MNEKMPGPFDANHTAASPRAMRERSWRIAVALCFFTFLSSFVASAPTAPSQTAKTAQAAKASQLARVTAALKTNFMEAVEPVTAFAPFFVTGDFNGDGAQDIAIVVHIKQPRNALPKDVRLLNPFESPSPLKFPNPAAENKLALAIIHSWTTAHATGKFLLIGESPVLILEFDRSASSKPANRKDLIELMSKRGKRLKGATFPRAAKGDVIMMGTEVGGDSLLYWNGRAYVWEDSPED
ncbi:MAG: hypothetical protein ABJB61_13505 [bacterium]